MAKEIERKFLINPNLLPDSIKGEKYKQGYISITENGVVRVRIKEKLAFIAIKTRTIGASRDEYEFEIPMKRAESLINICESEIVSKTRYKFKINNREWDVDQFHEKNEGLWIAEIELINENESFELPKWITREVTHLEEYYNSNLALKPFNLW